MMLEPLSLDGMVNGFVSDPPSTPVLLTTDEAAAGLEFPTADILVNYDLPWNPVLLEQRIERLDCADQESARVTIHNLFLEDSADFEILNPLQVNKRTARTSWSIADRGKRLPFSEIGWLGACPRLDESTADALGVARSSDPFR